MRALHFPLVFCFSVTLDTSPIDLFGILVTHVYRTVLLIRMSMRCQGLVQREPFTDTPRAIVKYRGIPAREAQRTDLVLT